ncbi:hypothetical protein CKA32_000692 [Geitlerinema sp. FC II]|nr:hypothetical protein CKA32_000692 [Geitlerinema sp. FC II]
MGFSTPQIHSDSKALYVSIPRRDFWVFQHAPIPDKDSCPKKGFQSLEGIFGFFNGRIREG